MKNFRSAFDITPWDASGSSFWGLKRNQAKVLGSIFIIFGILLAIPPILPDPTDALAIFLSMKLNTLYNIPITTTLLLLYTVVAWSFILLGIWIYPYNSSRLLNSYLKRAKRAIEKAVRDPKYSIIAIIVFVGMFLWYKNNVDLAPVLMMQGEALISSPTVNTLVFTATLILFMIIIGKAKSGDTI